MLDQRAGIYARGIALGGIAVVLAVAVLFLALAVATELAIIFLGVIIGIALAPVAEFGERYRIPKVASVLLLYAAVAAVLFGFFWYAIPQVANEVMAELDELAEIRTWYEEIAADTFLPPADDLLVRAEEMIEDVVDNLAAQALVVANVMFYTLAVLVVALFFTITKNDAYRFVISLFAPHQRDGAAAFLDRVGSKMRRFTVGTIVTMFAVGIMTYVGLTIIGVPLAPLLAVLAFLFELLPIVGPWLAFAPAFVVALTQGIGMAIAVAVLYLVIQQIESYVLVPMIHGRGTKLPGLMIISAIMVAYPLMGILGALIALPIAMIVHTVATDLLVPWRKQQLGEFHPAQMELPLDDPPSPAPEEPQGEPV